jgi:hypothetical protein
VVQSAVKEFLAGETPREQAICCHRYYGWCGSKIRLSLLDIDTTGQPLSDGLTSQMSFDTFQGQRFETEVERKAPRLIRQMLNATNATPTPSNV